MPLLYGGASAVSPQASGATAPFALSPPRPTLIFPVSKLPRSLPLILPFGLPAAGYPASARWPVFRFQIFSCSPRKCPTGGFRMPAEMITQFIQILVAAIRQILPHPRTQRGFVRQTEFPF